MTATFHVRLSWISWDAAVRVLPAAPEHEEFRKFLQQERMTPGPSTARSRDLRTVLRWASEPSFVAPLSSKAVEGAFAGIAGDSDAGLRSTVEWAAELRTFLGDVTREGKNSSPPYDEIERFLENLAATEFPALLLWSNRKLALSLFEPDGAGTVRLASRARRRDRFAVQAAQACLGYFFGSLGRVSPRDAWSAVGFGEFSDVPGRGSESIRVEDAREAFRFHPDLAWFRRNWPELRPLPLAAGVSPWEYLADCAAGTPELGGRVAELRRLAESVQATPLDYRKVLGFLNEADLLVGKGDSPHAWWVSRVLLNEVLLDQAVHAGLQGALSRQREMLRDSGLLRETPRTERTAMAFPLRVKRDAPETILSEAEEFFDWAVALEPASAKSKDLALHLPEKVPSGSASVYWSDASGARFQYVEPNPRRTAERFALEFDDRTPGFFREDEQVAHRGISPPAGWVDNRLVRKLEVEVDPASASPGDAVLNYTPLMGPSLRRLIELELSSPRYRNAADVLPLLIDSASERAVAFGRAFQSPRTWFLDRQAQLELLKTCHNDRSLACFFHLEIAPRVGFTDDWTDVFIDRRRSAMLLQSRLSWFHLLHFLKKSTARPDASILLIQHGRAEAPFPLVRRKGETAPAQLIVRSMK